MTLEQLRARLKELTGASDAITTKQAAENRLLTPDELKSLEDTLSEAEAVADQIKALERQARIKAAGAAPAVAPATGTPAAVKKDLTIKEKVGVVVQGLLAAKNAPHVSAFGHLDEMGYGEVAKEFDDFNRRQKALNVSAAISGGILVPTDMSNEIIELLRPDTSFLANGPTEIPMPSGNYLLPGAATGASASYTTESEPSAVTEQTFRDVQMSAKTLSAVIPVTNDMLNYTISGASTFVQNDLLAAMSEKMDSAAYRGDGVAGNPLGIYNITGVTSNTATNSTTPTIAQVDADLRKAINGLVANNVPLATAKWTIPTTTLGYLQDLRDGNGNFAYPSLQGGSPTLRNIPVTTTTNMPTNLGVGSNETFISLIAWRHILFGNSMPLELAVSQEASLTINGTLISLFQRRMTALLAVMQHDFNTRQVKAISLLTAVKWGK